MEKNDGNLERVGNTVFLAMFHRFLKFESFLFLVLRQDN